MLKLNILKIHFRAWKTVYAVVNGDILTFYKDEKNADNGAKGESSIPLSMFFHFMILMAFCRI